MDLVFLYNTFIGPLPDTYLGFLKEINQLFPNIFDTKVMAIKTRQFIKKIQINLDTLYKNVVSGKNIL